MSTDTTTAKRAFGRKTARSERRGGRYSVNLPELMAECDSNYLRLLKLFPQMQEQEVQEQEVQEQADHRFGLQRGEHQLLVELNVVERGPYTTLLRITQTLADERSADASALSQWTPQPRITVRLYHDARCAEVVDFQRARHFRAVYDYPNPHMRHPDEKAQVNRFLGEFLALCLEAGVALEPPLPPAQ